MRTIALVALLLAGCGETTATPPMGPQAPAMDRGEAPPAEPLASIRERSGCAFESLDALCEGFREHYLSAGTGWVTDGCARGERRSSTGPFAEVQLVGIRVGHDRVEGDARVERPLLDGRVREPPGQQATTQLVLAARIGDAWFPVHLFHPPVEGEIAGHRVEWSLDETGSSLTWTDEEGGAAGADPHGYGETERTIAVVDRGVPVIAARATIERWRSDVDLDCARACNEAPSPPPHPGCSRGCASSVHATRTWERDGEVVRIGATEVERRGRGPVAGDVRVEEAETRRLDGEDGMGFCAFMPVVRAVAAPVPPADPESVAARERARAMLRRGRLRDVPGARAAAEPGAPRAIIEIDERGGTACGGGGCSTAIRVRAIEGSMPEHGIGYFANERGNQVGCDAASLPDAGRSTIVEVAPAISREAVGCGLSGYDGTARRHWVVMRVLEGG